MDKRKKKKEAKSATVLQNKRPGITEDSCGNDDFTDHVPRVLHSTSGETDTLKVGRGPHQHEIEGSKAAHTLELGASASNDQQKTKDEHRSFNSADLKILYETVVKQRDDMEIILTAVSKQKLLVERLTDREKLGQCRRCVLHATVKSMYPTEDDIELTEAVQCTEDIEMTSFGVLKITVLLNDGKIMNVNSDSNRGDSGVQSGFESSVRVYDTMDNARTSGATSRSNSLYQPDGLGERGTVGQSDEDTLRAPDFAFDDDRLTNR